MEKIKSKSSSSTNGKTNSTKGNGSPGNSKANRSASQPDQSTLMEEFFVDSLKDIYWAEKHLLKALPRLEKAATTQELKDSFVEHLEVTRGQITRLEEAFEIMGKKPQAKKCEAMDGLTKEAEGIIEDTQAGTMTRDVALIMAAQKVEHYEIAAYGGLKQLAKTLGKTDLSDLMEQTLQEEKMADEMLTTIAENHINLEAASE
ncbi:MAG: ferritin-like domain-containing protein [Chitinophagaceae bacterium]|jgi:ferritin-like metal-binding protein YciE|nr:ferritin-like domain-containing protein [Chitinophagaceae bacterium]